MENVPLLQVKKMSKAFSNQLVLKEVNIQVERGDIYALVGGNGAGKSTLMKILTGLYSYDDGEMYVKGTKQQFSNPSEAHRKGIYLIPQEPLIFPHMTIEENICIGLKEKKKKLREQVQHLINSLGWDIDLYEQGASLSIAQQQLVEIVRGLIREAEILINRFFINQEKENALVNLFIEQFRIVVQNMNEELASLSGGNQQKVVLAKYLACNPKIIILDEPTRGIDAKARHEVYETIEKMKREGLAIILISSDVEEIVQLANRVYVMRNGQFISHLEKEQMSVDEVTRLAYGGVTE